jgi:signal transduction histidine kinase/ActR/RegA family two-component response regulator
VSPDGREKWIHAIGHPQYDEDGLPIRFDGVSMDVTRQKNADEARFAAEQKLHHSEGRYRSLFESIDEGFCVIEMLFDEKQRPVDYLFHEVNPAFEKQAGMHGAVGRRMLEFVSEIEAHWLENYGRVALTGDPIRFAAEYKSLGRWFDVYAFRVGDAQGRRVAVLFTNVTEQKLSEIALRESEERARAASLAKDNFLAQLSHELRTPLTPVLMTAAALRDDTSLSASTREAFAMIERNVALEARLIDDLLDLTRVTRGKLSLRTEACDVHALVSQAIEIVCDEGREKQIQVSPDLAASHRHVLGDRARLQQVIWNLLRNAVNFTPQGGSINISTKDAECVADGAARPGICIEVSDSGVGFDATLAENLFEPFYQATGSRSAGLGLGLAIARAIVELHHGSISARSDGAGRGATFTVTLPVSSEVAEAAEESSEVSNVSPDGKDEPPDHAMRLLVVEDHEATLRVLTTLLSRAGHAVTSAGTIEDALKAAREQPFDAVVSDLGLPDGTGLELMERLKAENGLTGVALSGYGMEQDVRRSRDAGFAAHLVKPVNFEDLRRALQSLPRRESKAGS